MVSSVTAALLCVAPFGCKDDKPKDKKAESDAKAGGDEGDKTSDDKPEAESGAKPKEEGDPVAKVAEPVADLGDADPTETAPISYATDMKTLLDLLPEDEEQFVLIRDLTAGVDVYDTLIGSHLDSIKPMLGSPEAAATFDLASAGLTTLRAKLGEKVMDTSKGAVFAVKHEALIYAAEDPNAFRNLLSAMGAEENQMPKHCVAPAGLPGYAACGDDKAKLEKLAAGNKGADRLAALQAELPGVDLSRANVAARAVDQQGKATFAITMASGALHLSLAMEEATAELAKYIKAGPAPAMALRDPGGAFVWVNLETDGVKKQLSAAVPMFAGVGETLSGEIFFGGIKGSTGLAAMIGISDPAPIGGLIALASSQLQAIPKEVDGTTIDAKMESIDADELEVNTIHVKLGGEGHIKQLLGMGMEPEAFAFAAGKYAAITIGAKKEIVQTIATYPGDAVTKAQLAGVPGGMADAMVKGDVGLAIHLPMDGIQAPAVRDYFLASMKQMPAQQLGGLDAEQIAKSMVSAVAPFSSLSMWITHPQKERVMHVVVQGFGDVQTAEGKDANAAVVEVAKGADPAATYKALSEKYPSSPAAHRYKDRSGDGASGASAVSSAFVLGMMAGAIVPAFGFDPGASAVPQAPAPKVEK